MKFEITLILMVLVLHCCYCVLNNNGNNNNNNDSITTVILKASAASNYNETDSNDEEDDNPIRNVIQCFRADSWFKCFNERVGTLVKLWREALLNSVRKSSDDTLNTQNHTFEDIIREFGKAVYYRITNFFFNGHSAEEEAIRTRLMPDDTQISDPSIERGHHKKKKVQKEIKKIILKFIIAIFLFKLKIKMILGMIQTVLINKFIIVAMLYVLTLTFKIWWEIKQHKLHDKSPVIYYDKHEHDHHDHTYELPPEYSEYEDHSGYSSLGGYTPSSSWSLWGRSYAPTSAPLVSPVINSPQYKKPMPYYIRPKTVAPHGYLDDELS